MPFGEKVMYVPMKTVRRQKGEAAKIPGIWLGINERTEENIVGTERGVVKCRTVSRLCGGESWDKEMLMRMKGVPWNPVPGREDPRIPVAIEGDDVIVDDDDMKEQDMDDDEREEMQRPTFRGGPDKHRSARLLTA